MLYVPSYIRPPTDEDRARWSEQSKRYRLLTGRQLQDVRDEIEQMFSREIAADITINPDLSRNALRLIYQQLNVAYLEPPDVHLADQDEADLAPIVTPRLWAQQQQTALYTLAIRECLVRVDWKHWMNATESSYRVVPPDLVVINPMPGTTNVPGRVEEVRLRGDTWTWEIWDVTDPAAPIFRIDEVDGKGNRIDATASWAPEYAGAYPYRDSSGLPILPYVLYHARVSSGLWSWHEGMEVAKGALRLAALWSHWSDGFVSAAHPQRWAMDVESQAGITRQIGGVQVDVIPTDRKSILKFGSKGPTGGSLGQFNPAMEPMRAAEALNTYEQGLAVYAGLNPSDLKLTQAQSGYAIVVSRAGQRRAQKLLEPSLRIADQELLATSARLANAYGGHSLPEDPRAYNITYRSLTPTPAERKELAEAVRLEMEMGLVSRLDAIRMLNPSIEDDEAALERLLKVDAIRAQLDALAPGRADTEFTS